VFENAEAEVRRASADIDPANSSLDPKKIDAVLGRSGELNKGVYKVTIGREVKMAGHTMGNAIGRKHLGRFCGSDDRALRRRRTSRCWRASCKTCSRRCATAGSTSSPSTST